MKSKHTKGTYKRKYYLHRQLKKQGFGLHLGDKNKTITVMPDLADSANGNKYVTELQNGYSYGVQFLNPIIQ
jgi:uncharacterized protein (UPF0128 family)